MKPEWNPAYRTPPSEFGLLIMRGMWLAGVQMTTPIWPVTLPAQIELQRAAFLRQRRLGVPVVKATYN